MAGSSSQADHDVVQKVLQGRTQEAVDCMPACLLQMVQAQAVLSCTSSRTTFTPTSVLDGGGFASLLKGRLCSSSASASTSASASASAAAHEVRLHAAGAVLGAPAVRVACMHARVLTAQAVPCTALCCAELRIAHDTHSPRWRPPRSLWT
jgi:hypothetical protein